MTFELEPFLSIKALTCSSLRLCDLIIVVF